MSVFTPTQFLYMPKLNDSPGAKASSVIQVPFGSEGAVYIGHVEFQMSIAELAEVYETTENVIRVLLRRHRRRRMRAGLGIPPGVPA